MRSFFFFVLFQTTHEYNYSFCYLRYFLNFLVVEHFLNLMIYFYTVLKFINKITWNATIRIFPSSCSFSVLSFGHWLSLKWKKVQPVVSCKRWQHDSHNYYLMDSHSSNSNLFSQTVEHVSIFKVSLFFFCVCVCREIPIFFTHNIVISILSDGENKCLSDMGKTCCLNFVIYLEISILGHREKLIKFFCNDIYSISFSSLVFF